MFATLGPIEPPVEVRAEVLSLHSAQTLLEFLSAQQGVEDEACSVQRLSDASDLVPIDDIPLEAVHSIWDMFVTEGFSLTETGPDVPLPHTFHAQGVEVR